MEQETLFTSSKWDILKCLEHNPRSPLDLAKETKTSVANISQQLRLLELAGFVKSERISNRDKGLPRILYSLSENYSYLIVSCPGFVDKKSLKLQNYQMCTLRIWFIDNSVLRQYAERFFWTIERHLDKIDVLAMDSNDSSSINVYLVSNNAELKKSLKDTVIDGPNGPKKFVISIVKDQDAKKALSNHYVIHDPKKLVRG